MAENKVITFNFILIIAKEIWEIANEITSISKGFTKTSRHIIDKNSVFYSAHSRWKEKPTKTQKPKGVSTQMKSLFPTAITVS